MLDANFLKTKIVSLLIIHKGSKNFQEIKNFKMTLKHSKNLKEYENHDKFL